MNLNLGDMRMLTLIPVIVRKRQNSFIGKYEMIIHCVNVDGESGHHSLKWMSHYKQKQRDGRYNLHPDLLRVAFREKMRNGLTGYKIIEFTDMKIESDQSSCLYRARPCFRGNPWYDFAYVEFVEHDDNGNNYQKIYPSLILGFMQINDETEPCAIVRTSTRDLPWDVQQNNFISSFLLNNNFEENYRMVPVLSIVFPMLAFQDYGGVGNNVFTSIPKSNWTEYFDNKIEIEEDAIPVEDSDSDVDYAKSGDELLDLESSDDDTSDDDI